LICPGFVDIHNHLPQFTLSGLYRGNLFEWLSDIVFPAEGRFSSPEVAERFAERFFKELLSKGTTTTSSYVTSHKEATDIAFQCAEKSGIRAFLGNVLMNQNAPDYLIKDTPICYGIPKNLLKSGKGMIMEDCVMCSLPAFAPSCPLIFCRELEKLQRNVACISNHILQK